MTGVSAVISGLNSDALAVLGTSTALVLAIPVVFKGWGIAKRIIGKF